jgi:hypothetical protein
MKRHHALEHATVAVLAELRGRRTTLAALSDPGGFTFVAPIERAELEQAARQALDRLRFGEHGLAITDDCGSTMLVTGFAGAVAALLTIGRRPLANFPVAIGLIALTAKLAPSWGRSVQRRLTIDPAVDGARVGRVRSWRLPGGHRLLRVPVYWDEPLA